MTKINLWHFPVFALLLALCSCGSDKNPTQSYCLNNSSNQVRTISFGYDSSGTYKLAVYEWIKPGERKIVEVKQGKYNVYVMDTTQNTIYSIKDYEVKLRDSTKSNYNLEYIDLEKDMKYALIMVNYVYEGNSLSESISKASGTGQKRMVIMQTYDGNSFFHIDPSWVANMKITIVDLFTDAKLPEKIRARDFIYGLLPVPKDKQSKAAFTEYAYDEVKKHIK